MNPYIVLGIEINASAEEIKNAYRAMSKLHHPDMPNGDAEKMKVIILAYRILSDPDKKRIFDEEGVIMDESPDHMVQVVLASLTGICEAWLERALSGDKVPMKRYFSVKINQAIQNIDRDNDDIQDKIKDLLEIKESIVCKSKNNIFDALIESKLKALKKASTRNDLERKIMIELKEAVQDYDSKEKDEPGIILYGTNSSRKINEVYRTFADFNFG